MTLIEKLPKRLEKPVPVLCYLHAETVRACCSIVRNERNLFLSCTERDDFFAIFFFFLSFFFSSRSFPFTHYFPFNYFAFLSLPPPLSSLLSLVFSLWRTKMHCFSFFLSFFRGREERLAWRGEKKRAERRKYFSFDSTQSRHC